MITIQRLKDKLTTRTILIVAFGLALTLLTLVIGERWLTYIQVDVDERNKLAFQTRLVEERVSGLIRGINVVLGQLARETGDSGCDQALLNRYASQYTEVLAFTVAGANGTIRCANVPALVGAERVTTDYFLDARATRDPSRLFVGRPYKGGSLGRDLIIFSRAVIGESGQLKRVVSASIDLRYFDDLLRLLLTEGQVGIVVHQSGLLGARYPEPDKYRYTDFLNGPTIFRRHLAGSQRSAIYQGTGVIDRVERYTAMSDVMPKEVHASSRLVVGISERASDVFFRWRWVSVVAFIIMALVSGVIVLMALLLSRRQRELIRSNQAKNQFLSSMSHELRTPLNAILGFAQINAMTSEDPEAKENTAHIIDAGWHLLELINEVLDLSKIEAGQARLSMEAVDLNELMQECVVLAKPLADPRGMSLDLDLWEFASGHGFVQADRAKLKQALLNYLSNAAKYGREKGSIRLSLRRAGGKLRIEVADEGEGIPADRLKELFQPFSRLGKEGGNVPGAGLGLELTRRLVELMGGQTGAESELGRGSLFWIELNETTAGPPTVKNEVKSAR